MRHTKTYLLHILSALLLIGAVTAEEDMNKCGNPLILDFEAYADQDCRFPIEVTE